jgi:hypothetical protein
MARPGMEGSSLGLVVGATIRGESEGQEYTLVKTLPMGVAGEARPVASPRRGSSPNKKEKASTHFIAQVSRQYWVPVSRTSRALVRLRRMLTGMRGG